MWKVIDDKMREDIIYPSVINNIFRAREEVRSYMCLHLPGRSLIFLLPSPPSVSRCVSVHLFPPLIFSPTLGRKLQLRYNDRDCRRRRESAGTCVAVSRRYTEKVRYFYTTDRVLPVSGGNAR